MKIAVCLIGEKELDNEYLNFFSNCFDLNNENTDIYILNNNSTEQNFKLLKFFGRKIKFIQNFNNLNKDEYNNLYLNENEETKINKINFLNTILSINNDQPFINNIIKFHSIKNIDDIPKKINFNKYYYIYTCIKEILKFEEKNNIKYDFIMKLDINFILNFNKFGPNHYFNSKNHVLFKDYQNLNRIYTKINSEDEYDSYYFIINNYCYYHTTKYLGGPYINNKKSYNYYKNYLNNNEMFNLIIKDKFFISISDYCFFAKRNNFIKIINDLTINFDTFYDENIKYNWLESEIQLFLCILKNKLFYINYEQSDCTYKDENDIFFKTIYGTEKT